MYTAYILVRDGVSVGNIGNLIGERWNLCRELNVMRTFCILVRDGA